MKKSITIRVEMLVQTVAVGRDFRRYLTFIAIIALVQIAVAQPVIWQQTNGPYGGYANSMIVDSRGTLLVGTHVGGVFVSTNSGNNWIQRRSGLPSDMVNALCESPQGQIYAGTSNGVYKYDSARAVWVPINSGMSAAVRAVRVNRFGHIFAGSTSGLFFSTNDGASWARIASDSVRSDVRTLALLSNGQMFAGTWGMGVFRSTDDGNTWISVNAGLTNRFVNSFTFNATRLFVATFGGVFCSTNLGISWLECNGGLTRRDMWSITSTVSGSIFAGSNSGGVFRSTDNGQSWTRVDSGFANTRVSSLTADLAGYIYAGLDYNGGVYRSTDNGETWTGANNGFTNTHIAALAINAQGEILAGSFGNIYVSTNSGGSWLQINRGLPSDWLISLAASSRGTIFAGQYYGSVYRSTDTGVNWFATTLINQNIWSLAVNQEGLVFAATSLGIFRSTNDGGLWISDSISPAPCRSIATNGQEIVFAGTSEGRIFRSTNRGSSWASVVLLPDGAYSLAVTRNGTVYAGTQYRGVYRSTDNGITWVQSNRGLTQTYIPSIASNAQGDVFVGTYGGVFRTTDDGENWEEINTGLFTYVTKVSVSSDGFLYAATWGGGIYRTVRSTTSIGPELEHPFRFALFQNYPNPFNPTTEIRYQISEVSRVTLNVFDMLGRKVATLVDEVQGSGFKKVDFDASGFTSGVYYYRLRAGNVVNTKKMILIR